MWFDIYSPWTPAFLELQGNDNFILCRVLVVVYDKLDMFYGICLPRSEHDMHKGDIRLIEYMRRQQMTFGTYESGCIDQDSVWFRVFGDALLATSELCVSFPIFRVAPRCLGLTCVMLITHHWLYHMPKIMCHSRHQREFAKKRSHCTIDLKLYYKI